MLSKKHFKKKPIAVYLVILLLIPFGIFSPKPVYAAEIAHTFVEQTTEQTHTGDSNWTDISGAEISSGSFVEGGKYLLIIRAFFGGNSPDNVFGIKVLHGSTEFSGSKYQTEPIGSGGSSYKYTWFTVWTAVASEGVKLQFANIDSTSTTVTADTITITAIRLDADLTEGTDWHYNEHASNDAAITIASGDHEDGDLHLILANQQIPEASTSAQHISNLVRSGEASNTAPITQNEGEDTTNGIINHFLMNVYELGAADNTFTVTETGSGSRSFNNVFSLNLAKFKVYDYAYTETSFEAGTSAWADLIQTLTFDLTSESASLDSIILGYFIADSGGEAIHSRLQIDNTDQPTGQTVLTQGSGWDPNDELHNAHITLENLSNDSHTIDLDGHASTSFGTTDVEDRLLIAFTMELAAAGGASHSQSYSENLAITDTYTRQTNLNRAYSEALEGTDDIVFTGTGEQSYSENLGISDELTLMGNDLSPDFNEAMQISDQYIQQCTGTCGVVPNANAIVLSVNKSPFILGIYNDATRMTCSASIVGGIIFNTDDSMLNVCDGTNWTFSNGTAT